MDRNDIEEHIADSAHNRKSTTQDIKADVFRVSIQRPLSEIVRSFEELKRIQPYIVDNMMTSVVLLLMVELYNNTDEMLEFLSILRALIISMDTDYNKK